MRKILLIGVSLVLLTAGTALAVKPEPQPEPAAAGNLELVGFTIATTVGGIGLFGMTKLCQAEYVGSRMCTSEEIMKSINIPELPSDSYAWVQPVIISTDSSRNYIDLSGIKGYQITCNNWSIGNASNSGFGVNHIGQFIRPSCNEIIPVACCAPAQ